MIDYDERAWGDSLKEVVKWLTILFAIAVLFMAGYRIGARDESILCVQQSSHTEDEG